jgi:hypothetical protein
LLYGAGALARETGYVGMSRGRRANHLYLPDETDPTRCYGDQLADLAAQLAISRTQTLATRQLHRSGGWSLPHVTYDALHQREEGISR